MPYKDITLYLDGSNPPPVVVVTEADTAWTFRFTVMYQNAIYAPNVANVILAGHKPDGNAFAYAGSKSGNTFAVNCNVQMTAVPGDVLAALHLLGGGNTAIPFILRVQPGAAGTDPVASASALPAYTTILQKIGNFPPDLAQYVSDWLAENVLSGAVVDNTFTIDGAAAPAKLTGDRLKALEEATIEPDATLTVSGAAADSKTVGDKIRSFYNEAVTVDEWRDGKSVYPNVTIRDFSAGSVAVVKVDCIADTVFHVTSNFAGGNIGALDEAGAGLSWEQPPNTGVLTFDFTAPAGTKTLLVTCKTADKEQFSIVSDVPQGVINIILDQMKELDPIAQYQLSGFALTEKQYIEGTTGKVVSNNNARLCTTDYIDVPPGATIEITNFAAGTDMYLIGYSFYTKGHGAVVYNRYNEQGGQLPDPLVLTVPKNAKYLRLTVYHGASVQLSPVITVYPMEAIKASAQAVLSEYGTGLTGLFDSCVCIGDSVTAGQGASGNKYYYPNQLKAMTGWGTTDIYAYAGYTSKQWFDRYFSQITFSNYDIAIIELGLNGGLTGSLETDVDPYDDYTQYADTLLGNYCKIIAGALAQNPNLFVVLTVSPNWDRVKAYRDVIYAVAEKYGCAVINLLEAPEALQDARFHSATDFLHFNNLGYYFKAHAIHHALTIAIAEHATRIS